MERQMFPSTMQVTTDIGMKPIADVQGGEQVLTHAGQLQPVTEVLRSSYSGKLLRIKTKLIGSQLFITPETSVLTLDGWVEANGLKVGNRLAIGVPQGIHPMPQFDLAEADYRDGLDVEVSSDTIRVRRPASYQSSGLHSRWVQRFLDISPDRALLCGYYVSEGTLDPDERCIRFTFAKDETSYHDEVARLVEKLFGISSSRVESNHGAWTTIYVYSRVIARWLHEHFGRGAVGKRLPVWLQFAEPDIQTAFLVGVMRGDGMYSEAVYTVSGRRSPKIFRALRLTLSNPILIQQIWHLCLRLGYDAAIRSVDTTYVTKNAKPTSQISMPPLQSRELVYQAFGVHLPEPDHRAIRPSIFRQAGKIYFEVENIATEEYTGDVYSCSVDEDHSCIAEGVAVQNFSPLPSLATLNNEDEVSELREPIQIL
jgi:intein/homing endonuclease